MRIADIVMFYDELELLPVRLAEHYDFVDRIYVVEATRTHRYQPKPLLFSEHRHEFSAWQDKIEYVALDADRWFKPDDPFANEAQQRNFLRDSGLVDLSGYDYLWHLDADEIIDRRCFPIVLEAMQQGHSAIAPVLRLFYYFFNTELEQPWAATRIFRAADAITSDVSVAHGGYRTRAPVGWHFSFLGPPARIQRKITSGPHVEFDLPEFTNQRAIAERMHRLERPFGPDNVYAQYGAIHRREPGDWLPAYVQQHLDNYRHYLYDPTAALAEIEPVGELEWPEVDLRVRQLSTRVRDQEVLLQRTGTWATEQTVVIAEREAEIRRLQAVLAEAVPSRDAEIERLQGALAEAVPGRDAEIHRLQAVLADAVSSRDAEIHRLQDVLADAVSSRDAEIHRVQSALEEAVAIRDAEITRLQRALDDAVQARDTEILRLRDVLDHAVADRDAEIMRLHQVQG